MYSILGCGGHARSILDIILFNNKREQCIFIDNNAKENEKIMGFDVYKKMPNKIEKNIFFIGIGDNLKRKKIALKYKKIKYCNIISKDAYIGYDSNMGFGNLLAHKAYIGPCVCIGNHNIINTNAVIEHECKIGDFCHIGPNSAISGRCSLGNNVFLGVGATVIDKIKIVDNVIIGAGAVVVNDILESGIYIGVPAKKLR